MHEIYQLGGLRCDDPLAAVRFEVCDDLLPAERCDNPLAASGTPVQ